MKFYYNKFYETTTSLLKRFKDSKNQSTIFGAFISFYSDFLSILATKQMSAPSLSLHSGEQLLAPASLDSSRKSVRFRSFHEIIRYEQLDPEPEPDPFDLR